MSISSLLLLLVVVIGLFWPTFESRPSFAGLTPHSSAKIAVLKGHSASVNSLAITPNGKTVVSASSDNSIKVWDTVRRKEIYQLKGHTSTIESVSITPDGKLAASGSWDGTVKVWDLEWGYEVRSLAENTSKNSYRNLVTSNPKDVVTQEISDLEFRYGHGINAVAITPDASKVLAGAGDGSIKIWDIKKGEAIATLLGHSKKVTGIAITSDGKRAISSSHDATLKVWDLELKKEIKNLKGHLFYVTALAITPDGNRAVSCSWDTSIIIWDLDKGKEIDSFWVELYEYTESRHRNLMSIAMTSNGSLAVSDSGGEKFVEVWDLDKGIQIARLEGHDEAVSAVAVTPDGRWAVSGSIDGTILFWDLELIKQNNSR